jgi:hypothetical protein
MNDNIIGVDEVTAMFKDLSASLKKKVIRGALKQAIQLVSDEVVPATPVHLGLLKSSAETKVTVSENGLKGKATFGYGDQNQLALFIEYGWNLTSHEAEGHKVIKAIPPAPWILPGFDHALPAAMEVFDDAVALATVAYER